MRRICLLGWSALVVSSAACDPSRPSVPLGDVPGNLEGSWTLELRLEHPAQLRVDAAAVRPVRGEVALLRDDRPRRRDEEHDRETHFGSHTLDVRPLGIVLRHAGHVPTVSARSAGADSVVLVLDPDAAGGGLTLSGRVEGDSATGRWWWRSGRSTGASGRFTMRRS